MICQNCEREFDEKMGDCPYCGAVPDSNMHGSEINRAQEEREAFGEDKSGPRVVYKQFNIGSSLVSWLVIIVVAAALLFFVLPVFAFFFIGAAVVWLLARVFMGF